MKRWIYHYCATSAGYTIDGTLVWAHPIRTMEDYRGAKKMIAADMPYLIETMSITSLSLLEIVDDED